MLFLRETRRLRPKLFRDQISSRSSRFSGLTVGHKVAAPGLFGFVLRFRTKLIVLFLVAVETETVSREKFGIFRMI